MKTYFIIQVSWIAKLREDSSSAEDTVLAGQLEKTAGTALCAARDASCTFTVKVKQDEVSGILEATSILSSL